MKALLSLLLAVLVAASSFPSSDGAAVAATDTLKQPEYGRHQKTALTALELHRQANYEGKLIGSYVEVGHFFGKGFYSGFLPLIGPIWGYYTIKGGPLDPYMGFRMLKDQGEPYLDGFGIAYLKETKRRRQDAFRQGATFSTFLVGAAIIWLNR